MTGSRGKAPGQRVLVVGGGPAGLAFALCASQRGLGVTVLDRSRPPVDKPCGEGLMPDGVEQLEALGVPVHELEGRPFVGIRYVEGDPEAGDGTVADGRFPDDPGLGIRRTVLHRALVRTAERAGVDLRWGVKAQGLRVGSAKGAKGEAAAVVTSHGTLEASWVVGADGLHSPVRRWAGLEREPGRVRRFGVRRHYRLRPWTDRVEVHWGEGCEAYVTPVGAEQVGVAMLWGPEWSGGTPVFDRLLEDFPALARRLEGSPVASRDRGIGPLHQRVRGVHRGRVALLGDAAGYLDAITGEGLSLAFHEAFALVEAIEHGNLGRYALAVRRLRRLPDLMTRLLLFAERRPALRQRLIRTFSEEPRLFARLLGIHARQRPPTSLGLGGALRLGWGLAGLTRR